MTAVVADNLTFDACQKMRHLWNATARPGFFDAYHLNSDTWLLVYDTHYNHEAYPGDVETMKRVIEAIAFYTEQR